MYEKIFKTRKEIDRGNDGLGEKVVETRALLRLMIRDYLWPNKALLAASMVSMALVAAATSAIPIVLKISADQIILHKNTAMLTVVPLAIIIIMAVKAAAEYASMVTEAYIGIQIVADLRKKLIGTLMQADLGWLQLNHSGRYVMAFMGDVGAIKDAAGLSLVSMAKNVLKALFLIGAMFYLDWKLALLAICAIPFAVLMLGRHRGRIFDTSRKAMAESGDMGQLITQALSGIRVVKAYDREKAETQRIGDVIDRANEYVMRSVRTATASGPMTEALTGFGFAAAIMYGGYRGQAGTMTLGDFTGFVAAALLIYQPMRALASLQTSLQVGVAAAGRVFTILDESPKVTEKPGAKPLPRPKGAIAFDEVSFAYETGVPVLREMSFDIPAGRKVALVGASGAGKSTVMNLLLRFYDPTSGAIRFDGQNIRDYTISSVRQACALVTQEPFLFDDTVRNNIAYGSETASDEAVEAAARAAVAHDFIMALPNGYETRVGEAGMRLSGGQRQRIAIARAMLRDAPILLLDEPTSALDSESEALIQEALDHLIVGKTVLMIAHRLSTVRNADMILVLDKGRVVERGTHAELVRRKGAYARLHRAQLIDDTKQESNVIAAAGRG
ncbi:MAG: ABC transporter ATP-binding protein [Flavobacteriaceae bacterium]